MALTVGRRITIDIDIIEMYYVYLIVMCFHNNYVVVEVGDMKASIAVISFILSNATKFSVDAESLSNELQQLGLPKGQHKHTQSKRR